MAERATHSTGTETFGTLLRRHRVAAALSQEALAERAGISLRAVSDLERGVRTRPYLETVRLLADALDLPPAERARLAAAARPSTEPLPISSLPVMEARSPGLPLPVTPLIGRDGEVAGLIALLGAGSARLATLTGPGGVGKTRLALAAAAELSGSYPDGVIWIALAPLSDASLVPSAVALVVGLREEPGRSLAEILRVHLGPLRALLVLDNCEHLQQAPGMLAAGLLEHCPNLSILATSRVPLRIAAEHLVPVEPLPLPAPGRQGRIDVVARSEAVRLFVQRSEMVRPDFTLTVQNAGDVAEICRRLDGLPLAIELAAARMRALSPAALRALLEERLRVLTGGPADAPDRQRTLRDTIAWSYGLLTEDQQTLFRRICIFAGGCTLEAAAAIASDGDPFVALDCLEVLVDQSLLRLEATSDGEGRYAMLATVREYGRERIKEADEEHRIAQRHAAWCQDLTQRFETGMRGPGASVWLDRLERDYDDLRAALTWTLDHDPETAARIAAPLYEFWQPHGLLTEGRFWLEACLAQGEAISPAGRTKVLAGMATLLARQGEFEQATAMAEQTLELARATGSRFDEAHALGMLGWFAFVQRDPERIISFTEAALTIWRELGDVAGEQGALLNLANAAMMQDDTARAREILEGLLDACRKSGDVLGEAIMRNTLGDVAFLEGKLDEAHILYSKALLEKNAADDRIFVAINLRSIAAILAARRQLITAARLFGAAEEIRLSVGVDFASIESVSRDADLARLDAEMAPSDFHAAFTAGKVLELGDAIAEATTIQRSASA